MLPKGPINEAYGKFVISERIFRRNIYGAVSSALSAKGLTQLAKDFKELSNIILSGNTDKEIEEVIAKTEAIKKKINEDLPLLKTADNDLFNFCSALIKERTIIMPKVLGPDNAKKIIPDLCTRISTLLEKGFLKYAYPPKNADIPKNLLDLLTDRMQGYISQLGRLQTAINEKIFSEKGKIAPTLEQTISNIKKKLPPKKTPAKAPPKLNPEEKKENEEEKSAGTYHRYI